MFFVASPSYIAHQLSIKVNSWFDKMKSHGDSGNMKCQTSLVIGKMIILRYWLAGNHYNIELLR